MKRLIALGILVDDGAGGFEAADVSRVRMAEALSHEGITLDDMAEAIHAGGLSFGWFRGLLPAPLPLLKESYRDRAAALDLPFEVQERPRRGMPARLRTAAGTPALRHAV